MALQAALLEQSLAVGHRCPAGSTPRARRAWSPSVPAGTLQETTLGQWPAGDHTSVHRASKGSERRLRGDFLLFEPRGRPGTTERGFCVSVLALMASEDCLPVSRVTSPFRAATTEGNRFTHEVFQQPDKPPTCGSHRLRKLSSCRPEVGGVVVFMTGVLVQNNDGTRSSPLADPWTHNWIGLPSQLFSDLTLLSNDR